MNKRKAKPFMVAIVLTILYLAEIFWLSNILGSRFGLVGTVLHEAVLALIGFVVFWIMHGKFKVIFPFRKLQFAKIAGTLVLWLGAYIGTMVVTMIITYFFPEEVMGASQDIQSLIMETPLLLSVLIVAVTPAICEEIAFRGALLSCFRSIKNRWVGIVIVAIIFGACHGSVWRMIPTMLLGIAMGYLLFETENMIYPMIFHFVNNAAPIILMAVLGTFFDAYGMPELTMNTSTEVPFSAVTGYLMYSGVVPFFIYVANYLLHYGQAGYDQGLFPREKRNTLILLMVIAIGMFLVGMVLTILTVIIGY